MHFNDLDDDDRRAQHSVDSLRQSMKTHIRRSRIILNTLMAAAAVNFAFLVRELHVSGIMTAPVVKEATAANASAYCLLQDLKTDMRKTPLGDSLVDYLEDMAIPVFIEYGGHKNYAGLYDSADGTITLRHGRNHTQMISTLAHEIRHHWQHNHLQMDVFYNDNSLSPVQAFLMMQYLEADARAFQNYFMDDRAQRLKKSAPDTPVIPAAYHAQYFAKAFAYNAPLYNGQHLNHLEQQIDKNFAGFAHLAGALRKGTVTPRALAPVIEKIAKKFNHSAADSLLTLEMRKLGAPYLSPDAPTYLQISHAGSRDVQRVLYRNNAALIKNDDGKKLLRLQGQHRYIGHYIKNIHRMKGLHK